MKKVITLLWLAALPLLTIAQTKTFKWGDELCEYASTYNSAKYTEQQLRNTFELMRSSGGVGLSTSDVAFRLDAIQKLNTDSLEKEYKAVKKHLTALDIVPVPYWETLRQRKLKQIEEEYALKKVNIQAYKDPKILKTYTAAPECVTRYADALIAGDDKLVAVWRAQVEEQCKNNGSPKRLRQEFDTYYNSPQRMAYARMEVLTFGWSNCANAHISYVGSGDESLEIDKQFRKLFIKTKTVGCDEP